MPFYEGGPSHFRLDPVGLDVLELLLSNPQALNRVYPLKEYKPAPLGLNVLVRLLDGINNTDKVWEDMERERAELERAEKVAGLVASSRKTFPPELRNIRI